MLDLWKMTRWYKSLRQELYMSGIAILLEIIGREPSGKLARRFCAPVQTYDK